MLCATDNDFYNALVCKAQGSAFGHHRTFQLATHQATGLDLKRLPMQQRGYFGFGPEANCEWLHQRLDEGWQVQTTKLSANYGWAEFSARLGEMDAAWLLLGGVSAGGSFRLYSKEQRFKLDSGWTVLYFAPVPPSERKPAPAKPEAAAEAKSDTKPDVKPDTKG